MVRHSESKVIKQMKEGGKQSKPMPGHGPTELVELVVKEHFFRK
jgi:hypothetical protein